MDVNDPDEKLAEYIRRVEDSPHNLTSKRARKELGSRHVPESLAFADAIPRGTRRAIDVGSGGGLPGVVIALRRPEIQVHLVESSVKKANFLRDVAADLGLPLFVHNERAEMLAQGPLAASFDVVTARAVAALRALLPLTVPFARQGGVIMAIKGARWRAEFDEAVRDFPVWGLEVVALPEREAADPAPGETPRIVILRRERVVAS